MGKTDQNVFDILQGVSILLCVKERDNSAPAAVYYTDMWGSREEKYRTLSETDVQTTAWTQLAPTSPLYLFVPQTTERIAEYEQGWEITDIFRECSTGIVTGRDKLTIHRTPESVQRIVKDFVKLDEDTARQKYKLPKDSTRWTIKTAQADIRNHPVIEQYIEPMHHRPLDTRFTYYTGRASGFHRDPCYDIMQHLLKENLALCVCRIVTGPKWQHALITNKLAGKGYISTNGSESSYIFSLYLYPHSGELALATERSVNLKPAFLTALSDKLGSPQTTAFGLPEGVSPEDILAYIYAVLYSPTYRERYNAFLKYGFPRIPLPRDIEHFRKLSALGQTLIDLHLLKEASRPQVAPTGKGEAPRHRFEGAGEGIVSKVRYADGGVWINPTQYFTDVPAEVWEYEIGAYQVCEKWLRDRKGDALSHDEVRQYRAVLVAVAETLQIMEAIDAAL